VSGAGPSAGALLLDAHGTLLRTRESVGETYARIAARHGVSLPAWRLDDAFRRVVARAGPIAYGGPEPASRRADERRWWHDRVRETLRATDQTLRFADFDAFFEALFGHFATGAAWELLPGARESLARAGALGLRRGIVSNFDHRLPAVLEALGIAPLVEFVALPCEGPAPKPETALLERALSALACAPERAVYVGDDAPEALAAIRSVGVRVWSVAELGGDLRALPERLASLATLPPPAGPD